MSNSNILSPKSDIIFKLFFSDERNIDLLRDFLKAVLDLPEDDYNELTVIDPHLLRNHPGDKLGILDVKLTSKTGKIIHLEIQVLPIPNMENRIIYYQAKMITEQLSEGENYDKIKRTITIVITDYNFIKKSAEYRKRFVYSDPDDGTVFTDISEIYALDLTKLPNGFDGSALCDWLKFIAAETEEEFNVVAERSPQIEKAVYRLKELSADERTRLIYDAQEKVRRDNRAREKGARLEGMENGIKIGEERGIKVGEERGIKIGERNTLFMFAKKMLNRNISVTDVVEETGLTIEEVENIRSTMEYL